jgi:hypothetical protein
MQTRTTRAGALRRWESLWLQQRRRKRARGGVRVAVPPASIANMVLWLDAGTLSLGDLDPVDTWFDGSGQGNDVYQDSASAYPTYVAAQINGQPVVRFDGVDDSLSRPSSASLALTQATIFVVRNAETWAAALSVAIEESVDEEFLVFDQSVVHHSIAYNYAELFHQDSHPGYFLQVGRYGTPPTALESFLNGVASLLPVHVVGDPVEYDSPERYVRVGGRAYGWQRFSGDIAEILMYSRSLSDTERIGVEEYLNQKYLLF